MTLEPSPDKMICLGDTSFLFTDVGVKGEFLYEYALILTCLCDICSWIEPGIEMSLVFMLRRGSIYDSLQAKLQAIEQKSNYK